MDPKHKKLAINAQCMALRDYYQLLVKSIIYSEHMRENIMMIMNLSTNYKTIRIVWNWEFRPVPSYYLQHGSRSSTPTSAILVRQSVSITLVQFAKLRDTEREMQQQAIATHYRGNRIKPLGTERERSKNTHTMRKPILNTNKYATILK